jgi:hypothetical protein
MEGFIRLFVTERGITQFVKYGTGELATQTAMLLLFLVNTTVI